MKTVKQKAERMKLVTLILAVLAAGWVLATDEGGTTGLVALILIMLTGVSMVMAFMLGVRGLDELGRKINLEALALAFGGVSLLAFIQIGFDEWGRPFTIEPGLFLLLLDGLWALGYFLARRKYQ